MNTEKLKSLCRICLKEQNPLKSLYNDKNCLAKRINQTFQFEFKFEESKDLPSKICLDCLTDLHHGLQFAERAKNSQERLSIMLDLSLDDDDDEATEEKEIEQAAPLEPVVPAETPLKYEENIPQQFQDVETEAATPSQSASPSNNNHEYVEIIDSTSLKQEVIEDVQQETFELEEEYLIEEDTAEEHYEINVMGNKYDPKYEIIQKTVAQFTDKIVVENVTNVPFAGNCTMKERRTSRKEELQQFIYKCAVCGKLYDKKTSLQYHIKTKHSTVKQHRCPLCSKEFAIKSDYVRHSRIHTNEKRFCCSTCGKKFTDRSTHLKHERIHTGSKPYECNICGKSFGYSFVLKNHILTHTGVKDFSCPVCEKAFARKTKMKDHLKRVHKKEINADGEVVDALVKIKTEIDIESSFVTIE